LRTYPSDYKVIIVGDASMSPYEIVYPGGSVEYWNEEAGAVWMERLLSVYNRAVWLNPIERAWWGNTQSVDMIRQLMDGRMFPLTLEGLDEAMRELTG
jgi:hypothetical protein